MMNPHIHKYSILPRVIQDVHLTSSKMTMVYAATCPDPTEVQWGVKQLSDETGPIRGKKGELLYDMSQKKDSSLVQWRRMRTHTMFECRQKRLTVCMGQYKSCECNSTVKCRAW